MADDRRIEHLEHAVRDLARQHERLQQQLAALLDAFEDAGRAPAVATRPAARAAAPAPGPSLLRRALKRGLRSTVGVARRLWQASEPDTGNPMIELVDEPARKLPELAAVVLDDDGAARAELERQTGAPAEILFWDRRAGELEIAGAAGDPRRLPAPDAAAVRAATRADFLLTATGALASLPATALELTRLALAAEALDFLEVGDDRGRPALLVARRELWHPETGLDPAALDRERRLIGKTVDAGEAPRPRSGTGLALRTVRHWAGRYRLPRRRRASWRHVLRPLALPPAAAGGETPIALLASAPLAGGFDELAAGLLRAAATPPPLLVLAPSDALQRERLRRLGRLSPRIYPLADYLPAELVDPVAAQLVRRWGARRILHLGLEPLAEAPEAADVVELPAAAEPPWRVAPPPAAEDAGALRRELGIDPDAVVVTWAGDLVRPLRPEDFLALAHRLRDHPRFVFLLAGRGPLADAVADLERYLDLPNLHRLPAAPGEAVHAATDVACATGERQPHPTFLLEALARGRPAAACPVDGVGELLADGPCGIAVPVGDADALAAAVERLGDADERRRLGERGPRAVRRFTAEEAARRLARLLDPAGDASAAGVSE